MLYVGVSCFVVRGCAVSRRYIDVCNCDTFSVVYVYLDHLKIYDHLILDQCFLSLYAILYIQMGDFVEHSDSNISGLD